MLLPTTTGVLFVWSEGPAASPTPQQALLRFWNHDRAAAIPEILYSNSSACQTQTDEPSVCTYCIPRFFIRKP